MDGGRLKRLRLALGVSVAQFADLIGCSTAGLYRWEEHPTKAADLREHQQRLAALLEARADHPAVLRQLGDILRMRGAIYAQYALFHAEFGRLPREHVLAASTPATVAS